MAFILFCNGAVRQHADRLVVSRRSTSNLRVPEMSGVIPRGVIPTGLGLIGGAKYTKSPNPYSWHKASKCQICGKPRTPKTNHAKCSRELQKRYLAEKNQ